MIEIIDKRKDIKSKGTRLEEIAFGTVFSGRIGSCEGIWLSTVLGVVPFTNRGPAFSAAENTKAQTECMNYKAHMAVLTVT